MSRSNPEVKYPIPPNVLIDYIKTTPAYPIYIGSDFMSFSTEPYMGKGCKLPSEDKTAKIENDKLLDKETLKLLLNKVNLSMTDIEEYLKKRFVISNNFLILVLYHGSV